MSRVALTFLAASIGAATAGIHSDYPTVHCHAQAKASASQAFRPFKLISSRYESPDCRRFFFSLKNTNEEFMVPVASCIALKYVDSNGKETIRPYTPISSPGATGEFELLVKRYPKGKMGNYLFNLKPGDEVLVKGPFQKFCYTPNQWKHVGMLAGGTGATPMYQFVKGVLSNSTEDKTELSLVLANNKRQDILLANEWMELNANHENFHLYVTLREVPKRWLGGIGLISREMISTFMPPPNEKDTKILVSGPQAMMKSLTGSTKAGDLKSIGGTLREMGYAANQVFMF